MKPKSFSCFSTLSKTGNNKYRYQIIGTRKTCRCFFSTMYPRWHCFQFLTVSFMIFWLNRQKQKFSQCCKYGSWFWCNQFPLLSPEFLIFCCSLKVLTMDIERKLDRSSNGCTKNPVSLTSALHYVRG